MASDCMCREPVWPAIGIHQNRVHCIRTRFSRLFLNTWDRLENGS